MASLIAGTGKGRSGKGAYGLAPGVKILPLKIDNGKNGQPLVATTYLGQIGQAITYAADAGAKVISVSQGMSATWTSPDDVAKLTDAIARATAKGALVVASVGNDAQGGNPVEYPGGLPKVVGVGAVDRNGTTTSESERGPQVDLAAPGMDMVEACIGSTGYCQSHGTSDAAALVSASAALVWSMHQDWTANQVTRVLINTAGKPSDGSARSDNVGYGAVRPRVALATPGDPGPADVSPIPEAAAPVPVPSQPSASSSAAPSATASASASSSASAVPSAGAVPSGGSSPVGSPAVQPQADKASDSGSTLPIVVAVVVGLVLVAGVIFFVVRKRAAGRSGPAAPMPPVPSAPVGYPPQQGGPAGPPVPPVYGPPAPPGDNPYAR